MDKSEENNENGALEKHANEEVVKRPIASSSQGMQRLSLVVVISFVTIMALGALLILQT